MSMSDDGVNPPHSSSGSSCPASSAARSMAVPQPGLQPRRRPKQQTPQEAIDEFWGKFSSKTPGKAMTIIPQNPWSEKVKRDATASVSGMSLQSSYDVAAAMCRAKVEKIVKECRRINKKYRDLHYDIETDLKLQIRDCLESLANNKEGKRPGSEFKPQSAKRVPDIFDKPEFYIDGPTANDVRQGRDGDCWLMSALCTLSNKKGLIERLCVAHDQNVGVYGFVFHRDGEWISEIVDDFLYLTKPDYDEGYLERVLLDELERLNPEEAYRKIYQSNSNSLYFAQCQHPQETWLPLLEKAYAKAHGDYAAIEGGFGGEGIEDLTGGVTSELFTTDILDKEYFWKEELLKVNKDFLFGCSTGVWGNSDWGERKGIIELHAYSIQRAIEIDGKRLLRLKNPWGKGEWKGPWSDGSKEWTPEWLEKLDHRFGDDGDFWIAYEDLLRKYQAFERTRLFDENWRVNQIWTTFNIPWTLDYHDTRFCFKIQQAGPVVLVLAQLDDRYFRGLQGQYHFVLAFRLHKKGHEDYLVRSEAPYRMRRSVNVELELETGEYEVRVRLDTSRVESTLPVDRVIRQNVKARRDKLIRTGMAYDLAHSKGAVQETAEEVAAKEARERRAAEKQRAEIKARLLSEREQNHYLKTKNMQRQRARSRRQRKREETQKKMAAVESHEHQRRAGPVSSAQSGEVPSLVATTASIDLKDKDDAKSVHANGSDPDAIAADLDANSQAQAGLSSGPGPGSEASDDDFSDDALSVLSDRELQIQIDYELRKQGPEPVDAVSIEVESDRELDDFERNPWNAVAVIGLRVYHKSEGIDDNAVDLRILRSNPYLDSDEEPPPAGLDVDDAMKDATLQGGTVQRKRSIIGDSAI